jgi:hypothetical protein
LGKKGRRLLIDLVLAIRVEKEGDEEGEDERDEGGDEGGDAGERGSIQREMRDAAGNMCRGCCTIEDHEGITREVAKGAGVKMNRAGV